MSKLPPPINIEGMSLEAIHEAIQDCHDWPGMKHPSDHHRLAMYAACEAMRLESALESARADLKRGGVVVPELTEEDLVRAGRPYCINDREPFQRGARWAEAFIRKSARPIPADRVLEDGMVQVRLEWLRDALALLMDFDNAPAPVSTSKRLYALLSAPDALVPNNRVNQGGLNHVNV